MLAPRSRPLRFEYRRSRRFCGEVRVKFSLQSLCQFHVRVVGCVKVVKQRNKILHLGVVAPLASSLKRLLAIRTGARVRRSGRHVRLLHTNFNRQEPVRRAAPQQPIPPTLPIQTNRLMTHSGRQFFRLAFAFSLEHYPVSFFLLFINRFCLFNPPAFDKLFCSVPLVLRLPLTSGTASHRQKEIKTGRNLLVGFRRHHIDMLLELCTQGLRLCYGIAHPRQSTPFDTVRHICPVIVGYA
mmetsp:Transcript_23688/g.38156  ORF Transcript_23688/g.38156 Transcript_23688/m.38156 type:complete len:240 (-) Transcript_23688:350-1069(-)